MASSSSDLKISVILPVRDGAEYLGQQLTALASQEVQRPWELVIIDDGSVDGSWHIVQEAADQFPAVQLFQNPHPRGKAFALNAGSNAARARTLAFVDQDDVVAPGYLLAMSKALEHHALVCGTVDLHALNADWLARGLRHWPDPNSLTVTLWTDKQRQRGSDWQDLPTLQRVDVPVASGCTLGIQRQLLREAGLFRTDVGVCEDSELCIRLWSAGLRLHHVPEAVLHYRLRPDLPALARQRYGYGHSWAALFLSARTLGMRAPGIRRTALDAASGLLATFSTNRATRARGVARTAFLVGRLVGCIRYRVLYI